MQWATYRFLNVALQFARIQIYLIVAGGTALAQIRGGVAAWVKTPLVAPVLVRAHP